MTRKINEMYAFVSVDPEDDTEGIIAMKTAGGYWLPLVGADMNRVDSLRAKALELGDLSGREVKLLKFSAREELPL